MVRKNVAEILQNHVTFELEAIDRMYLNADVPSLQTGGGVAYFLKAHLGVRVPSTVMVAPMSQRFVDALERLAGTEGVDLVTFKKGQPKDDSPKHTLRSFSARKACSSSARRKKRPVSFAQRSAGTQRGRRTPG
jgi:hypothetical protein